jgi:dihydroflavonol-4-reductase
MSNSVKKVFVLGSTGFLGYFSALEFLKKGIKVGTITRDGNKLGECFPKQIDVVEKNFDVFEVSEEKLAKVFKGYDALVYSLGPDDRVVPDFPAYDFFYEKLVVQCTKVVRAARFAGVKRVVIMNSYFAFFDRKSSGKLAKNHPYVKARVEQAKACINIGKEGEMDVMILELPYIFGCMPTRTPLWKDVFLKNFEKMKTIYFPKGGTAMVHVRDVGRIVVAAILRGKHGRKYPVGNYNMKFKEMIEIMYEALEEKKKVATVPTWLAYINGVFMHQNARKKGKESGLHYAKLMTDILSQDFYFSSKVIKKVEKDLNFKYKYDVKEGIVSAMKACYPERFSDFNAFDEVKKDLEEINNL